MENSLEAGVRTEDGRPLREDSIVIRAQGGGLRQGKRGGGEKGWILDILWCLDFTVKLS